MESDESDGEINDEELVRDLLMSSTQPSATVHCANRSHLLYITEDIENILTFIEELLQLMPWQSHDMCLAVVIIITRCFKTT